MAKRIGDAGMVLPDAPKLMFENALALGEAISVQMSQLLRTSLGVESNAGMLAGTALSSEQRKLLEEWQGVTTKARLMPKLNFHELVEAHYPIPFLATIKGVRDKISPKPEEAFPEVIEHYPRLLEVVAEWEQSRLEVVGTLVKEFSAEDGTMSEERYRAMHIAMAIAFYAYDSWREMSVREAMDELASEEHRKMGMLPEARTRLLAEVSLEDVEAADRCLKAFADRDAAADLRASLNEHERLLCSNGSYPDAIFRKLCRQKRKLDKAFDEAIINRHMTTEFEQSLMLRKVNSDRTRIVHEGVIPPLNNALQRDVEAPLPAIDRSSLSSGALGIKLSRDAPTTAEEATQLDLPPGTPVDEHGNPLNQPRRPERLDLSSQVAMMEAEDLEDTEEATFEDFRFLIDDYGFRGLQIGNYVPQKMRRYLTGAIHQAVEDMADIAKIPPTLVALGNPLPDDVQADGEEVVDHQHYAGRSLGLALGARGRGKAAAHYEPGKHIINMTRDKGAGSLAHEWGHALDFSLSELCNFRQVRSQYDEASIARVTGRARGTGVETLSEAFAVFWTVHTNQHIERFQEPPKEQVLRRYAGSLLKPEHDTPENLDMLVGMGQAMKGIYAEDVPDEQLSRDHGARLSRKLNIAGLRLDTLMVQLSYLHHGTLNDADARGKLMSEDLWSFDGASTVSGVRQLAKLDAWRVEDWAAARVRESAAEMLGRDREPHQWTMQALEMPVRSAVRTVLAGAKLQVMALDNGRVWSSDHADGELRAYREQLLDDDKWDHDRGWMALHLGEFLRHTPEQHREKVEALLESIDMHANMLSSAKTSMEDELMSPTPHDMERTMAMQPAAIDLHGTLPGPGGREIRLLYTVHSAGEGGSDVEQLAKGAKALFTVRYSTDPALRDSRLEVHPRLLSRIQASLTARFDHLLESIFLHERQIIEAMEIEDPEDERPHPLVPSPRAREAIQAPAVLKAVQELAVEQKDERFQSGSSDDLVGRLGIAAAIHERLAPVLAEPTAGMQFSRLIDVIADTRRWIHMTRMRQNETEEQYQARHAETDKLMETFEVLAPDFPGHDAREQQIDWLRNALSRARSDLRYTIGAQSAYVRKHVKNRALHQVGAEVNMILDKLAERCVTRPLTMALEEPKDPRCTQESYQAVLRNLAGLADDYGPRFAYMTPEERHALLNEGLAADLDWSRDALREAFRQGSGPVLDHNSLFNQHIHPPADQWTDIALKSLTTALHRNDMGRGERNTLAALRGDHRRDLAKGIPIMQTSRMARASATYEKRHLARNGYLRGSAPKYWSTPVELFARAFETYTFDALEAKGRESPYLVTVAGRDRQERVMQQSEAVIAKDVLYARGGDLVEHENLIFHNCPADYSFTYPAGHMRGSLAESFAPLMTSLAQGLGQRYPEALALHEAQQTHRGQEDANRDLEVAAVTTDALERSEQAAEVSMDTAQHVQKATQRVATGGEGVTPAEAHHAAEDRPEATTPGELPAPETGSAPVPASEDTPAPQTSQAAPGTDHHAPESLPADRGRGDAIPPALEELGSDRGGAHQADAPAEDPSPDESAPGPDADKATPAASHKNSPAATLSFDF